MFFSASTQNKAMKQQKRVSSFVYNYEMLNSKLQHYKKSKKLFRTKLKDFIAAAGLGPCLLPKWSCLARVVTIIPNVSGSLLQHTFQGFSTCLSICRINFFLMNKLTNVKF